MQSRTLSCAKATLFTNKFLLSSSSYETNSISISKLRKAFPKMNRMLNEKQGWSPLEKICFQVYHKNDNTIVLSLESYLFRFEFTESEFVYGLSYLFHKNAIKLNLR